MLQQLTEVTTAPHSDAVIWNSPLGFGVCSLLLIFSLVGIFSNAIKDDIITRVYYWANAFASATAIYHLASGTNPESVLTTIVVALAIKMSVVNTRRLIKYYFGKDEK